MSYSTNYGSVTSYSTVRAIVIAAAGSVEVPPGAVEIDAPGDLSKSGTTWSSTTGGLLTFYDASECDQVDKGGSTLTANTTDQTAL